MTSSQNDLPSRMYRNGRPVDHKFDDPDEILYRRCQYGQVLNKRLLPESIDLPKCCTNRSRYSEPEDILLPYYLDWGIAAFKIKDVPLELSCECGKTICNFRVEHKPEDENYSHTEAVSYNNRRFD